MSFYDPNDIDCPTCGLGYLANVPEDRKLHNRMHGEWLDVSAAQGIEWFLPGVTYENLKHKYRIIFGRHDGIAHTEEEIITAIVEYLRVQYAHAVWGAVRSGSYKEFKRDWPNFSSWLSDKVIDYYGHEFTDYLPIIHQRYPKKR